MENRVKKVSLTKLQIDLLQKGLLESKQNVDSLLEGNKIKIEENDKVLTLRFIDEAKNIGVCCYYIQNSPC